MDVTEEQAKEIAEYYQMAFGQEVDPDDVVSALVIYDDEQSLEKADERYGKKLWDKASPINGTDAATVLEARDDIPKDGEVYLIIDNNNNGQVIIFQPHVPDADGFEKITQENWDEHAEAHRMRHVLGFQMHDRADTVRKFVTQE